MRVGNADDAGLHPADLPRRRAQQEDVASHALDREIFVDGSDDVTVRLDDDVVVGVLRDRAARGDRGDARAAPRPQLAVDPVVVEVRAAAPARRRDAVGQHGEDVVVVLAGEVAIRIGRAHRIVEVVRVPVIGGARRDDLLREDVERCDRDAQCVHRAGADAAHERRALEQLVAGRREQPAFRLRSDPVAGTADPLQRDPDRAR